MNGFQKIKKTIPILIGYERYPPCNIGVITSSFISCSIFSHFSSFSTINLDFGKQSMVLSASVKLSAVPAEDGIARRCWVKFRKEAALALFNPFVVSLASGNLKLGTFHHYIAQDVHFLRAFAQAYEMAKECSDDDDAKTEILDLQKSTFLELEMHNSFMQQQGFDLVEKSCPDVLTVKYTDFLLATASGYIDGIKAPEKLATPFEKTKVAAYTLGSIIPCIRLKAFLGKELLAICESWAGTHPYKEWIDNYSSDAFQARALKTEDLLEKLSVSLTGEELDVIEKLYHLALKLKTNCLQEQSVEQNFGVPLFNFNEKDQAEQYLMLFSDFDLTCSVVDSSAILAEIAIRSAPRVDPNQSDNQPSRMSSADLRSTWGELSKQYTEEYEQCVESILSCEKVEKFNYQGLWQALEQLSNFEKKANKRVIVSGVLKGLNVDDIRRAGEFLVLQDGCIDFFLNVAETKQLKPEIHVLSYCWCADLIRSSFTSGGLSMVNVHANEFLYESSLSTGEISKKVESPIDKVESFCKIIEANQNDKKILTVYIGDSLGDLLCLVKADIGIVVGESTSLRRVGSHFGVSFVPLFQGVVEKHKRRLANANSSDWKGLSGTLYTVSSWADIHAFILRS